MSNLPKYRRDAEDLESAPLFKQDERASIGEEPPVPAYPPRLGDSLVGEDERHTVTYTFVPRWPVKGENQDAIGVLGRSKEEAISIVQSGFRDLDAFDADRIELLAPVNPGEIGLNDDWGLIMDEAWAKFKSSPPRRLKVQIRDGPGDKEAREKRNLMIGLACIATFAGFTGFVFFLVWLCGGFEPTKRPQL